MNLGMLIVPDGWNLGASMHTLEKGEEGLLVQASTTAGFLLEKSLSRFSRFKNLIPKAKITESL